MEVGDGQANTIILELVGPVLAIVGVDCDVWSSGWVLRFALDLSDVVSSLVSVLEAKDNIIPDEDVIWVGEADVVCVLDASVLLYLGIDVSLVYLSLSREAHGSSVLFVHELVEKGSLFLLIIHSDLAT